MHFQWDEDNLKHVARHSITPAEAEHVINNDPLDLEFQFVDSEERILQVGITAAGRILMVATTWRRDKLRVVTAFPASSGFRQLYLKQRGDFNVSS